MLSNESEINQIFDEFKKEFEKTLKEKNEKHIREYKNTESKDKQDDLERIEYFQNEMNSFLEIKDYLDELREVVKNFDVEEDKAEENQVQVDKNELLIATQSNLGIDATNQDINKPNNPPKIPIGIDEKDKTQVDKKPINTNINELNSTPETPIVTNTKSNTEKTNNQEKNQSFLSKHKRTLITSALFLILDVCLIIAANQAKLFSKIVNSDMMNFFNSDFANKAFSIGAVSLVPLMIFTFEFLTVKGAHKIDLEKSQEISQTEKTT